MRTTKIQDQEPLSLFQIIGPSSSTCGYCSPSGQRSQSKSSKSFGIWAHQMSCKTYKELIDRGWRRSGSYVYKPDMRATCCPQYTIRLEASEFRPGTSQRKIVNRFNNFVRDGGHEGEEGYGPPPPQASASTSASVHDSVNPSSVGAQENGTEDKKGKGKGKGKHTHPFDLTTAIHESEISTAGKESLKHKFEVTMEPASFTREKYELYKRYQMQVHGDKEFKVTEDGFTRFLCDSPLELERSPNEAYPYGSFHQLYRMDGRLIAIGVLDLLPGAVSAVYFIYDPQWSALSLGKLSALRECALAIELERLGFGKMYYMMGYYIHTCQKMRYKAEYAPSFLLDPVTYEFLPFDEVCKPILDKDDHAIFSEHQGKPADERDTTRPAPFKQNKDDSVVPDSHDAEKEEEEEQEEDDGDDDEELSKPPPPGFLDPDHLPQELLMRIYTFENGKPLPLIVSKTWRTDPVKRKKIREGVAAMGSTAVETCLFA